MDEIAVDWRDEKWEMRQEKREEEVVKPLEGARLPKILTVNQYWITIQPFFPNRDIQITNGMLI